MRLVICDEMKKNKRAKFTEVEDGDQRPYLPEELILEIFNRLSFRDLSRWSCISKYWYKTILSDSRFASTHFDHNKNKLTLFFNLLNVWKKDQCKCYFLRVDEKKDKYRFLIDTSSKASNELVGYCNGLVCTKVLGKSRILIVNPTRKEMLTVSYVTSPTWKHLCHGFCFDSLSQQYKVVIIYTTTSTITGDQEFVCMILTLWVGATHSYSWTKTVTSTAQISPSPFPGRMVTRCSKKSCRPAALCGGDLLWRITNRTSDYDSKVDMLLSFDIHDNKIRFIHLPTECSLTGTTTTATNENQYLVIDHHLLEFKGYLCVARSEKIMTHRNRHHRHRCHRSHPRNGQRSSFCCCGFKVHLFVLKDKVNQVWSKGETFDLQIKEEQGLLPAPFCCFFDTTNATDLPLRILSFSDQLLLYWSDGEYLLLYNLQMKHLKVIKCTKRVWFDGDIFETKMKKGTPPARRIGDDNNRNFPYMDYQLQAQPENILSLKSFIAEGETKNFYSLWEYEQSKKNGENKEPVCLLSTPRELVRYRTLY